MTESNTAQLSTPSNTTTAPTSGNKETTDSVRFTAKLAHNSIKARCNNRIQTMAVIIAAAMLRIIDSCYLAQCRVQTTPKSLHTS